jgi:hypothetical protein
MAYKLKAKKGRPLENYKIRNLEGITPKKFEFEKVEGNKAIYIRKSYKRKLKRENET